MYIKVNISIDFNRTSLFFFGKCSLEIKQEHFLIKKVDCNIQAFSESDVNEYKNNLTKTCRSTNLMKRICKKLRGRIPILLNPSQQLG